MVNNLMLLSLVLAITNYAIGGIPFGWLISKLRGVDIRKVGSGNIGAANVARALGTRWGILVFLLDVLKGLGPTLLTGRAIQAVPTGGGDLSAISALCWLFVGLCTVFGHNHSLFLGFRGGKGVATSLGVALGVYPELTFPALLGLFVWVLSISITKMSSVGSILGGLLFPVFYLLISWRGGGAVREQWPFLMFSIAVGVLLIIRHRANISRILAGTEARFGSVQQVKK